MRSENYLSTTDESLLHEGTDPRYHYKSLLGSNHYNLELGGLEEDLEDDFESEYDENDWEEEE
ncbi:MAG: hypothetical protein EOP54_05650 [Sphingobacteriales bacterium]|jgi:hypothetical protein|nr:MAG: hypothetical protein EOP54_05650 [Sphingobacteriales bacterium]